MDENNVNKNTKKGLIIGGAILVVLLLIGAIVAYYFTPIKPKKVFIAAIDKIYEASKSNQQELDSIMGKVTLTTDLHTNDEAKEKILEILNNMDIRYEYGMDFKEKSMHVLLDTFYKEKELLNATFRFQDDNAYVYLKDIYDKALLVPMEDLDNLLSMVNQKDYDIILKHLKNALNKALKEEYFTKENVSITLNDKRVKVTKNNLLLSEENLREIIDILKQELNNDEFIESVAHLTSQSREEVQEMLEEINGADITLDHPITISIYTKRHDFKGFEITDEIDSFSLLKNKDTEYSYEIKTDGNSYKGNLELKIKGNDMNLKVSFITTEINGSIIVDFGYTENAKLPEFDTNNTIPVEDLTEEEQMKIIENIQKKEGIALLMQTILNSSMLDYSL